MSKLLYAGLLFQRTMSGKLDSDFRDAMRQNLVDFDSCENEEIMGILETVNDVIETCVPSVGEYLKERVVVRSKKAIVVKDVQGLMQGGHTVGEWDPDRDVLYRVMGEYLTKSRFDDRGFKVALAKGTKKDVNKGQIVINLTLPSC